MESTKKDDDTGMTLSSQPWTETSIETATVTSATVIVNNTTSVEYKETQQLWNTNTTNRSKTETAVESDCESPHVTRVIPPKDDTIFDDQTGIITKRSPDQHPIELNVLVVTKEKKPKRRKSDKKQQVGNKTQTNTKSKKKLAQEASTMHNVDIWSKSLSDLSKSFNDLNKSTTASGETMRTKKTLNTEMMDTDGRPKQTLRRKSKFLDMEIEPKVTQNQWSTVLDTSADLKEETPRQWSTGPFAATEPRDSPRRRSKLNDAAAEPKENLRRSSKVLCETAEPRESPKQNLNLLEEITEAKETSRRESTVLNKTTEFKGSQRRDSKMPRAAHDLKDVTRRRKSSTMQREVDPEPSTDKRERKNVAQSPKSPSISTTSEAIKIKFKDMPVNMFKARDTGNLDAKIPMRKIHTGNQRITSESGSEQSSQQLSLREWKGSPFSDMSGVDDKIAEPSEGTRKMIPTSIPSQKSTDADIDPENQLLSETPLQLSKNVPRNGMTIQDTVADALKASIIERAISKFQTISESVTGFLDGQAMELPTYTITSQDKIEANMAASAEFSLPLTDYSDITSEGEMSSMVLGSCQTSVLPALESDENQYHDEPLALYAAYTTSLADISTTGGTDTTSTLNTHTDTNTAEMSFVNEFSERILIAPEDDKECKQIIPWLNESDIEQKNSMERKSSFVRKSSIKLKSSIFAPDALDERRNPRRRSLINFPGTPQENNHPEFARDVSLPADIAIVPHVDNRISSTTLTRGFESGSVDVDPKELYLSWGSKRFRAVMNLTSSKEESYQTLGAKSAKKKVHAEDVHDVLNRSHPRRNCLLAFVCFLLVPSLIIGITVPLVRRRRHCTNCDVTLAPTSSPSFSVGTLETILVHVSSDEGNALMADNTPQSKAFHWLVAESSSRSMSETRMIQRYALATLYFATEGDQWFVKSSWLSANDECGWFSTDQEVCNPDGEVINLSLAYNSLRGELPKEVGLLTSLKVLDFTGNALSGTLPNDLGNITTLGTDLRGLHMLMCV
jgi:hypothetical protein